MSYVASADQSPAWISQVPEDWRKDWLKWHVFLSTARPDEEQQEQLPYLSNEDIASWTGKLLREDLEPRPADSRLFCAGDVLFNKLRPYLAKVFHANFDGVSSGELLCLRPSERVNARYLFYVLTSFGFIDAVDSHAFGSKMPRADWETVGHQPLPLPGVDVQQRIARFLNEKTARIDALIEKKQALLERLAEKRQALITRAVTKGLNPDVPMKPSEMDWVGEVPAHWGILRLKFIVSEPLSYGANAAAEFDESEWPRFVRITDVDDLGGLRDETFRSLPPEMAENYLLQSNDILMARSGATVGKSFIYKDTWGVACYAGYLIRARIGGAHDARFFYWFMNSTSYWQWVRSVFIQSTIQNISADKFSCMWIAHPPSKDEQREIADSIEASCMTIDRQNEEVVRSIERLHEYRSALITAAVTGQLAEVNG